MKNLKSIIITSALVASLLVAVGCSKKTETPNENDQSSSKQQENINSNAQKHDSKVGEILNAINTPDYLSVTETNEFVNTPIKEYDVEELKSVYDKIEDGFVLTYPLTNLLQEVILIKTTDTKAVTDALRTLTTNNMKYKQFADGYGSEENAKVMADSILSSKDDYVYFIAAPKAKDIEAKLLEIIK